VWLPTSWEKREKKEFMGGRSVPRGGEKNSVGKVPQHWPKAKIESRGYFCLFWGGGLRESIFLKPGSAYMEIGCHRRKRCCLRGVLKIKK